MNEFELVSCVFCGAKDKRLPKSWWEANVNKLALVTLETQTKLSLSTIKRPISFSVFIIGAERMRELNAQHRGIDKVTDVLSFPVMHTEDPIHVNSSSVELELGDIFICLKKVFEQAEEYGHLPDREAAFLFVHGFLHLLGYDHQDKNAEREMFGLQAKILEEAGLPRY